jgi:predicted RNA-binding protein YlqC (UPF0109 family)
MWNNEKAGYMRELLAEIVKHLVDSPEHVRVTEIDGTTTKILELFVVKEDLGKIIGKQGQMIRAIRTIMMAASVKTKKRIVIEVLE